jgi:transcriptional regulator with XRE-family HTH domain
MLPIAASPEFPAALKAARQERGMSRAELARAAGIHQVMPRRYEEPEATEFTRPTRRTWILLNRALGFQVDEEREVAEGEGGISLREIPTEELVGELHRRNFTVTLSYRSPDQGNTNPQQNPVSP